MKSTLITKPAKLFLTICSLSMLALSPGLAQSAGNIDFGTDAGDWTKDGECDDPRFHGPGSADELVENDRMRDATDCQVLFQKGQIEFHSPQFTKGFDFGDNASEWADDGECDDPRFEGSGSALLLLAEDAGHDAGDCKALFQTGQIMLSPGGGADRVNFGDNSSDYANDGECDDFRFDGKGMAETFLDADIGHDANDCSTLYYQDQIAYRE